MTSNDGWRELCVHEFAEIIGGTTPSTAKPSHFGGDIPWITPKDLSNFQGRYIARGERNLTQDGVDAAGLRILPRGAVLLSTRAPVGYVAVAKNPLATNQGFRSLVVKHGFEPEFVYYLLRHDTDRLKAFASGTTFGELSGSTLGRLHYHVPPLVEQRSIAHVLGSLDDKIELNRGMNQTLEEICRALFKFWFVDFGPVRAKQEGRWKKGESLPGMPADMWDLWPSEVEESEIGEIPAGWEVRPLGEVASFTRGVSYRGEDLAESKTALVNLKCAGRGGAYREDGLKAYRGPFKEGQVVEAGDVVVSQTDVTQRAEVIGRAYVVRQSSRFVRLVASLDMAIVRPSSDSQTREYLAYALSEERFRDHAYGYTNGTTVLHLSSQALPDYPQLVPTAEIVSRFSEAMSPNHELIAEHSLESDTLTRTRDALLPKLLSGELRVRWSETQ